MKTSRLFVAAFALLLATCAGAGQQLVAYASSSGTGDVRTDGDVVVVVGDLEASLGIRTGTGIPVFLVPPTPMERDQWYVRSSSHGFEGRGSLAEPMPAWVRPLFLDEDLKRLEGLGIHLVFEEPAPPAAPPASP
jgi:hypothetical protein